MTFDIRRILVPLDFSPNSTWALDYAHFLARRFHAALHLLHVCELPSMMTTSMDARAAAYWSQQSLGEEAEHEFSKIVDGLDVQVTTEVRFGNPAKAIVDDAAAWQADLIVMGTHGHGVATHLLMGNVAERVVRLAPCPVLTIREPQPRRRVDRSKIALPTERHLSPGCGHAQARLGYDGARAGGRQT